MQTNCQEQFVYQCKKRYQASQIVETCQHSCIKPTEELKAKHTNVANRGVYLIHRWCINFSQSGRYNNTVILKRKMVKKRRKMTNDSILDISSGINQEKTDADSNPANE